jgi:O-acetyl-ADP-ribose deacetylase (regulator of RNase III)
VSKESQKIRIKLVQGDLTDQEVDAIVNAANNHLWMGAGVAGAIKRKGGTEIEKEAMSKGPIPVGEAVVTRAGKLKAKHVIHAAVMGQDLTTNEEYIRSATLSALRRAEELKIKSIAFPAFGTGVGGFAVGECARIMLDAVKDFSERATQVLEVRFVLFDEKSYAAWILRLQPDSGSA